MMKIFLFNILRGPNKRGGLGSDKRPRRLIEKIGYFDAKSKYEFLSLVSGRRKFTVSEPERLISGGTNKDCNSD